MAKYEFAIKKDVLNSGKINYTPVCRLKPKFKTNVFTSTILSSSWMRICCIYGKFVLMELDWIPVLTYVECEDHIKGYQDILSQQIEDDISIVEFHKLEEKQL